jgi:Domain of unknown function (DUF5664)
MATDPFDWSAMDTMPSGEEMKEEDQLMDSYKPLDYYKNLDYKPIEEIHPFHWSDKDVKNFYQPIEEAKPWVVRMQKIRYDLLPWKGLKLIAELLNKGLGKHKENDWLEISEEEHKQALLRHIFAYASGEKTDPEYGFSNLVHAGCRILFILSSEEK